MGEHIASYVTNRMLIFKIYIQLIQFNNNKIEKKWAKYLNNHFSKEEMQMASKHMKSCSTLLIIREMQIKISVKCHLTPVRMVIIKSLPRQDIEKRALSHAVGGKVNWYSHYGKQYGDSSEN